MPISYVDLLGIYRYIMPDYTHSDFVLFARNPSMVGHDIAMESRIRLGIYAPIASCYHATSPKMTFR